MVIVDPRRIPTTTARMETQVAILVAVTLEEAAILVAEIQVEVEATLAEEDAHSYGALERRFSCMSCS